MAGLHELLEEKRVLLIDGAMGTELFARGLEPGTAPELWNIEHPERVQAIHADYIAAGSDIVLTNSFGGTAFRLRLHQLGDQVLEVNEAAGTLAHRAADATDRGVIVAGSMGPSGELLEPLGTMTHEVCAAAFAEQAKGLAAGGVDAFWIETMSHLEEVTAAVEGVRSVSDLPICTTLSFDTAGRTMMGTTGTDAATRFTELGVDAIGANCGRTLADTEAAVAEIGEVSPNAVLISKANAGLPKWHGTDLRYDGTPEVMAAYAYRQLWAGVRLIGGCCGSSPEHIAMMRRALDGGLGFPGHRLT